MHVRISCIEKVRKVRIIRIENLEKIIFMTKTVQEALGYKGKSYLGVIQGRREGEGRRKKLHNRNSHRNSCGDR